MPLGFNFTGDSLSPSSSGPASSGLGISIQGITTGGSSSGGASVPLSGLADSSAPLAGGLNPTVLLLAALALAAFVLLRK